MKDRVIDAMLVGEESNSRERERQKIVMQSLGSISSVVICCLLCGEIFGCGSTERGTDYCIMNNQESFFGKQRRFREVMGKGPVV